MNELTLVLFAMAILLFVISTIQNSRSLDWLTFFVSICSMGLTVYDETLVDYEMPVLVAIEFFIMLFSGWSAWGFTNKGGR